MQRISLIFVLLFIFNSINALASSLENKLIVQVKKGDTLSGIINSTGVKSAEVFQAIKALNKIYSPKDLKSGQNIEIALNINDDNGQDISLKRVSIKLSPLHNAQVFRTKDDNFKALKISRPLKLTLKRAAGEIDSSLFADTKKAGMPVDMIMKLISNYSYDIDFQRDIKKGDSFEVLYEQYVDEDGENAKSGNIIHSTLNVDNKDISMYYFKTMDGRYDFYNNEGQTARKSFLRTPVDGARITSSFGRRKHPILGYTRMHKGIDFGAARGTPIYAAGDGVIIEANRKGSYGKYVKIRHSDGYSTAYAHLNKYGKSIKRGRKVEQGQIIGYVGTTGRSTGPHLHYELIKNGQQVNPLTVKSVARRKLKSLELGIFLQYVYNVDRKIAQLASKQMVASNENN